MSAWVWRRANFGWARQDYTGILGWKRLFWRLWRRDSDFVWKG